jgi:cyclopropane-fatty-acyl-phospholipid synthase
MTTATLPSQPTSQNNHRLGWIDRQAKNALTKKLSKLQDALITLVDDDGSVKLGDPMAEVSATITIRSPRFYRRAVTGGNIGVAQAYVDGDWECDDLTTLFRIMVRQIQLTDQLNNGFGHLKNMIGHIYHAFRKNTLHGSKRNIEEHYDLGNEFFELFLDDTMSYSCGLYNSSQADLKDASITKMNRLCQLLNLSERDHLLEIGTGWGGLAIHAARKYGCRVTTTTLSGQQYKYALKRIREARMENQVSIVLQDYRSLSGQFDKLVSVEMIEAVGHNYLPTYFGKCADLLKPDGQMAIQAITMPDYRYERYRKSVDFIQRFVFPGSCVPSLTAMSGAMARASDLRINQVEEFGSHYARTLSDWRDRFLANINEIKALGYPDRLMRLWNYYLSYCEAGFKEGYTGLVQMRLTKPRCGMSHSPNPVTNAMEVV